MQAPPAFRSVATVRLVNARDQMTAGMSSEESFDQFGDFIETQIQVLLSESVARTAVQRSTLRLEPLEGEELPAEVSTARFADSVGSDPFQLTFHDTRYSISTGGTRSFAAYGEPVSAAGLTVIVGSRPALASASFRVVSESDAVSRVMGGFRASARQSTNVLDLSYTGSSPHETRRVVNALAEGFQAQNAASAQQQSRRRRIFLENQLRQTDSSLAVAAGAFSAYRSGRAVFSSSAKAGAQEAGLVNIDMRRAELDAEKTTYENLLAQAVRPTGATASGLRALISSPGIASNPVVQQLYTQLSEQEAKRDNLLSSGVASTNPDLISVRGMISTTTDQIVDAIRSQVTSLQARIASLDRLRASGSSTIAAAPAGGKRGAPAQPGGSGNPAHQGPDPGRASESADERGCRGR